MEIFVVILIVEVVVAMGVEIDLVEVLSVVVEQLLCQEFRAMISLLLVLLNKVPHLHQH